MALRVLGLDDALATAVVRLVHRLRSLPLRTAPSIAETVDWARTLVALGATAGDLGPAMPRAATVLKLDA